MAAGLVLAQLQGADGLARLRQRAHAGPAVHHRPLRQHAQDILEHLSAELPEVTDWSGTVGVGIAANNVEYFDEPALASCCASLPT
jgi:peptide deformylase